MSSFRYRRIRAASRVVAVVLLSSAALGAVGGMAGAQQQPGQFVVVPQDGRALAQPPMTLPEGATIGDVSERVQQLSTEAGDALDKLLGSAVTPREKANIEAMAERRRRNMILELQLQEAKLAKQIWTELNGKEEEAASERLKKVEEEKAILEKRIAEMEASRAAVEKQANDEDEFDELPVVSSISGGPGTMEAEILVPYAGAVRARVGTALPNGMKVSSIGPGGVVAIADGRRVPLAFGDSVPRLRVPRTVVREEPIQGVQMGPTIVRN